MKTCIACQQLYEVTDMERLFLEKISPVIGGQKFTIPEPSECPDCRLMSRVGHRNEQYMYHNVSSVTGKPLIALYSPDTEWGKKYKMMTHEEWWSDDWDGMNFGRDFDFNRPFFEQFHELCVEIPHVNLIQVQNENSPFTTGTGYCKNCHLINCSENCEDCMYGKLIQNSRDVIDSDYIYSSEMLYECFNVTNCNNCVYISYSQNSFDCGFSENLKGCRNCFLCTNLNNKEFYFMNKRVTPEEYAQKVAEFLGSKDAVAKAKEVLRDLRMKRIRKYANIVNCENSSGDFLTNCQNCTDCYDVNDSQDCKYVHVGVNVRDIVDCSNMYLKPELNYQVMGTIETYSVIFSLYVFHSQNVMYSEFCFNSSNLFGCSGLRKKQYCIFNKQYTKEEYEILVPKIIQHMVKTGEWGKMFPLWMSPYGYNESVAMEYLPLTKEQVMSRGGHWKEKDQRDYKPQTYIVPDAISDCPDDILKELLACERCGKNFRVILKELTRLRDSRLPIPAKCPECRHLERMELRNPPKLYARTCMKCEASIETTYPEGSPEVVTCEKCYLEAVY
jgi:hypothetical protein